MQNHNDLETCLEIIILQSFALHLYNVSVKLNIQWDFIFLKLSWWRIIAI